VGILNKIVPLDHTVCPLNVVTLHLVILETKQEDVKN